MRHLAFLKSLEELPADSAEWAETARGYALLLIAERWAAGEKQDSIASGLSEATALIDGFDRSVSATALDSLTRILAFGPPTRARRRRVGAALLRYSLHLAYRGLTPLADDVAEVSIRCCGNRSPELRWRACRIRGQVNRTTGNLDVADSHFRRCVAIGRRFGIFEAVARGRTGIVHVMWSRGNLPAAERHALRLLRLCQAKGRRDLTSVASHDLGAVLCWMKRYDEGIPHMQRAFEMSHGRERDRIANDLAFALSNRGSLEAARCVLETLVTIGSEPVALMCARINLLQVYGGLGDRAKLDAQRQELEGQALCARDAIYFHLTLGEALVAMGDGAEATPALQRAAELAARDGFGQALIDADIALAKAAEATRRTAPIALEPSEMEKDLIATVARVYAGTRQSSEPSMVADGDL